MTTYSLRDVLNCVGTLFPSMPCCIVVDGKPHVLHSVVMPTEEEVASGHFELVFMVMPRIAEASAEATPGGLVVALGDELIARIQNRSTPPAE